MGRSETPKKLNYQKHHLEVDETDLLSPSPPAT